jgi:hypothetical protein
MTATLTQLETNCESMLDEIFGGTNQFRMWSAAELVVWLNEGCRDIARRTEDLQVFDTAVNATPGLAKYALPADTIRVHRVEFAPVGSTLVYPMRPATIDEMDPVIGINPARQSSYPYYFFMWGYPPNLVMQVFPVPSQRGTFNIYRYKMPAALVNAGDIADIPNGWEDLLVTYVEYRARRKNRDPLWSDVKNEYEEKLAQLIEVTQTWHDAQRFIITQSGLGIPSWLYEPSWE